MRPKVFGIGLPKTGTKTLGTCLRHFGMRHLSGRRDLLILYRQGHLFKTFAMIDNFDSFEDDPYPYMYRELFIRYGDNARFVLTTRRDPQTWLDSLKRHCMITPRSAHWNALGFGYAYPHGAEREHLDAYERHVFDVRQFFRHHHAQDRLLEVCWDTGDDWKALCGFLGEAVPAIPFPHENRGQDNPVDPKVLARHVASIRYQLVLLGKEAEAERFAKEMASAGAIEAAAGDPS